MLVARVREEEVEAIGALAVGGVACAADASAAVERLDVEGGTPGGIS
jgi:hypothetical protein